MLLAYSTKGSTYGTSVIGFNAQLIYLLQTDLCIKADLFSIVENLGCPLDIVITLLYGCLKASISLQYTSIGCYTVYVIACLVMKENTVALDSWVPGIQCHI